MTYEVYYDRENWCLVEAEDAVAAVEAAKEVLGRTDDPAWVATHRGKSNGGS